MASNPLWAPGQWRGRASVWRLPEILSDAELEAVVRCRLRKVSALSLKILLAKAKADEGYTGAMCECIDLAQFYADTAGRDVTEDDIKRAVAQHTGDAELKRAAVVPITHPARRKERRAA